MSYLNCQRPMVLTFARMDVEAHVELLKQLFWPERWKEKHAAATATRRHNNSRKTVDMVRKALGKNKDVKPATHADPVAICLFLFCHC